jgi:hypothetical protein
MEKFHRIIKLTFWTIALPFLGIIATYDFFQKTNPFNSPLFLFAVTLCIPMLILKGSEFQDEAYDNFLDEFRQMTSLEFFEKEKEIMSLPINQNSALIKEAYKQVYKERSSK